MKKRAAWRQSMKLFRHGLSPTAKQQGVDDAGALGNLKLAI